MFHAPWVGWYAAIEDLIPTLPETQPAPWQQQRLPAELRETILIGAGGFNGSVVSAPLDAPSFTVTANRNQNEQVRAYLVQSKNTGQQWGDGTRGACEPAFSIMTDPKPSHMPKAYLLAGDNARVDTGEPIVRRADEPAMTMRSTRTPAHRAYTAGRWVRMTVQALGRFQTVPDDYRGLTPEINGNGVPCLLARRIMESL